MNDDKAKMNTVAVMTVQELLKIAKREGLDTRDLDITLVLDLPSAGKSVASTIIGPDAIAAYLERNAAEMRHGVEGSFDVMVDRPN